MKVAKLNFHCCVDQPWESNVPPVIVAVTESRIKICHAEVKATDKVNTTFTGHLFLTCLEESLGKSKNKKMTHLW